MLYYYLCKISIESTYRRLSPDEFQQLCADPKAAEAFWGYSLDNLDLNNPDAALAHFLERDADDRQLCVGKDWHALHFLLTGDGELHPNPKLTPPFGNVVLGGTETEWSCSYGKVRFLSVDEVRDVARVLGEVSAGELRSRFSIASFNEAGIYPHGRRNAWTEDDAESVFETYPSLVNFFSSAAAAGDMVLLSSD